MLLSASRRTDLPAFYSEWFLRRLREGFLLVRHPRDAGVLWRVGLSPEWVDCIVFWTKNPLPMLGRLDELDRLGYPYYFQFTLTPYGPELEPGLPDKRALADAFRALSARIGPGRVVWRYDPVVLDAGHPLPWHLERFQALCGALAPYTRRCVFSFVDAYPQLHGGFRELGAAEMRAVAEGFAKIAGAYGLPLDTCCERLDLAEFGIRQGACIDPALAGEAAGAAIRARRDPGQRPGCGCAESVDVGAYGTCRHGCAYCYAGGGRAAPPHDTASPLLCGRPRGDERIVDRTAPSLKDGQLTLY